jgi:hypothetical protein
MTDVALSLLALIAGGLTLELFGATWPAATLPEQPRLPLTLSDSLEECQAGNPS